MIDFGLSKQFIDSKTGHHIPFANDISISGTIRYASMNAHMGIEQSRRDDLEGMLYVLIYFMRGKLPWEGKIDADGFQELMKIKTSLSIQELCKDLPEEFATLLNYVRKLKFDETPNYDYLRETFQNLLIKNDYINDQIYDWDLKNVLGKSAGSVHLIPNTPSRKRRGNGSGTLTHSETEDRKSAVINRKLNAPQIGRAHV